MPRAYLAKPPGKMPRKSQTRHKSVEHFSQNHKDVGDQSEAQVQKSEAVKKAYVVRFESDSRMAALKTGICKKKRVSIVNVEKKKKGE